MCFLAMVFFLLGVSRKALRQNSYQSTFDQALTA